METDSANLLNQLQSTLRQMETALGAIADAVVWVDAKQRIERCNPAFRRLVNCSDSNNLVGDWLSHVLPLRQAGNLLAPESYPDVQLRRQSFTVGEYDFQRQNETRVLEISGNGVGVEDGDLVVLVIRDVTSERQAAAAHQKIEQEREQFVSLLQATLESTADGILVITRDRHAPVYNRKFLQMWQIPESLMQLGQADNRLRFLSERTKNPEQFLARVWELFRDRADEVTLELLELKDGQILERFSQPLRNGEQIIGRVWSFRDITERKRAEASLSASETKFRRLVENASDLIYTLTPDGTISYVSPNIKNIMGYEPGELEGQPFMPLIYPEDLQPCLEALSRLMVTGERQSGIEYRIRYKDETWHWQISNIALSQDLNGQFIAVGVTRDITDRKQSEAALKQAEEQYRSIFENAVVGMYQTTPAGRYISVNPTLARMHGYSSPAEMMTALIDIEHQLYVDSDRRHEFERLMNQRGPSTILKPRFIARTAALFGFLKMPARSVILTAIRFTTKGPASKLLAVNRLNRRSGRVKNG